MFYAAAYKREQEKIWDREQDAPRTARQKREWMHQAVARSHERVANAKNSMQESSKPACINVIDEFNRLGYIDPQLAVWNHCEALQNYKFEAPVVIEDDYAERIENAFSRGAGTNKSKKGLEKWIPMRK